MSKKFLFTHIYENIFKTFVSIWVQFGSIPIGKCGIHLEENSINEFKKS